MVMLALAVFGLLNLDRPDVLIADFEGPDYGRWTTTGTAFGAEPAQGTLPGQMVVSGFKGHGLANSYLPDDRSVGTLTSPEFRIERQFLDFLIGGGGWRGETCMNLFVAGKVVRSATGPNVNPGGSEALATGHWDVRDLKGQMARLQIVDKATGGWGHINVDQITQTDHPIPGAMMNPMRKLKIERRYLNLPVHNRAPRRRLSLTVDGRVLREFEINLAEAKPDYWAFLDVSNLRGQSVELSADSLPAGSKALQAINQSDQIKTGQPVYKEALRPQFHFTSRVGWLNDPNGLVYSQGEYHLFYQHNPFSWEPYGMHWGHAVSPDLVHWKELPTAIYPHSFGDWCWSGSAIVDRENTSGFKTGKDDVIVAAYTSTGRGECIVYSNDRGRTFTDFNGNPVVRNLGRDPRLFWYEPSKNWVMAVYDEREGEPREEDRHGVAFYTSPNLKTWTYQSRIGNFYECPDIFQLPVDGHPENSKWVLTAADSEYMIGQFDGHKFTPETPKLPGSQGQGFYAAQTFSNLPEPRRRVQIGWMRIAMPGMPFNQMMAFPCDLTLHTTPQGIRMFWNPTEEIARLHGRSFTRKSFKLSPASAIQPEVSGDMIDLEAEFSPGNADSITFRVNGVKVTYHALRKEIWCGGKTNSLPMHDGKVAIRILADRNSIEIFGNDGALYMPMPARYPTGDRKVEVFATGGAARFDTLEVRELKSAWR